MYLTWLDSNSWLIEMGGKRVLLDPWLVGSLIFWESALAIQRRPPDTSDNSHKY